MTGSDRELLRRLIAARAVRTFVDRPVALEVVRSLVETAKWTGSARNRQPWRFRIVTDRRTCEELSTLGAYARHLAGAPCVLVLFAANDGRRDTVFDVGRVGVAVVLAENRAGSPDLRVRGSDPCSVSRGGQAGVAILGGATIATMRSRILEHGRRVRAGAGSWGHGH